MHTFTDDQFYECEEIGSGGEGSVHRAKTKTFGWVAVKVFHSHLSVNVKEIENMRKFSHHPNIVQFFGTYAGASKLSPQLGYVMKYMPLGSLYKAIHIDNINYTLDTAFSWILQGARAIAYLHEKKCVHRDIKPANMLLSDSRRIVMISDFGLAKIYEYNSKTSFQGATYLYQSPEIFTLFSNYNIPSDVFSFAISMWEIITKRVPYDDNADMKDILVLKEEVIKGTRPSLEMILDTDVKNLLARSWSPEPENRPSMKEIATFFEGKHSREIIESGDDSDNEYNTSNNNPSVTTSDRSSSFTDSKPDNYLGEKEVWERAIDQDISAEQLMDKLTDLVCDEELMTVRKEDWSPFTLAFSKFNPHVQELVLSHIKDHAIYFDHVLPMTQEEVERLYSSILDIIDYC